MIKISPSLASFQADETGAVTTDFVVMTAAICTLGVLVGTMVYRGVQHTIDESSDALSTAELTPIGPL